MELVKQTQKLVMGIITAATVFGWQAVPAAGKTQEYQWWLDGEGARCTADR